MNNGEKMNGGFDELNNDFNVENNLNQERERKIGEMANSKVNSENDSETKAGEIDISAYQRMFAERDAERAREAREKLNERQELALRKAKEKPAFREKRKMIIAGAIAAVGMVAIIVAGVAKLGNYLSGRQYADAYTETIDKVSAGETEDSDQEVQTELGFETPDETIKIESVTFYDGPNVREEPVVISGGDGDNSYGRIGEEGESITLDNLDTAYFKEKENDKNGNWYGFSAEELAEGLKEENYISDWRKNRIKGDKNGIVWVNDKYCSIKEAEDGETGGVENTGETGSIEDTGETGSAEDASETGGATKEAADSEGFESLFN